MMPVKYSDDTQKTGPMARKKTSKRKKKEAPVNISRQMSFGQVKLGGVRWF